MKSTHQTRQQQQQQRQRKRYKTLQNVESRSEKSRSRPAKLHGLRYEAAQGHVQRPVAGHRRHHRQPEVREGRHRAPAQLRSAERLERRAEGVGDGELIVRVLLHSVVVLDVRQEVRGCSGVTPGAGGGGGVDEFGAYGETAPVVRRNHGRWLKAGHHDWSRLEM